MKQTPMIIFLLLFFGISPLQCSSTDEENDKIYKKESVGYNGLFVAYWTCHKYKIENEKTYYHHSYHKCYQSGEKKGTTYSFYTLTSLCLGCGNIKGEGYNNHTFARPTFQELEAMYNEQTKAALDKDAQK
ncbi:MAG: hypothetical protein P4L31_00675 [Candidatus Babeliales bacterium]|nr:hypothetical protein [Candidatus Babeliales bacterium]